MLRGLGKVDFPAVNEWEGGTTDDEAAFQYHSVFNDGAYVCAANSSGFRTYKATPERDGGGFTAVGSNTENSGSVTYMLLIPNVIPSRINVAEGPLVAVGYLSGLLSIFAFDGKLLLAHSVHNRMVSSIKFRCGSLELNQASEILLQFADGIVVLIDASSLWMSIYTSLLNNDVMKDHLVEEGAFVFKKFCMETQAVVTDIVSIGPTDNGWTAQEQVLPQASLSGEVSKVSHFSSRLIGVGKLPMISFYGSSEASRSYSLAGVAQKVSSAVSNAVFSFAKSLWGSKLEVENPEPKTVSATLLPSVLSMHDQSRHVTSISLSPSCCFQRSPIAALFDSLGRVLILDVEEGEIVRIIKGARNAQLGWVQALNEKSLNGLKRDLFLVVYHSRGVLELYQMIHGARVAATHVGIGLKLVQGPLFPVEGQMIAQCFLATPEGVIKQIVPPSGDAAEDTPRTVLESVARLIESTPVSEATETRLREIIASQSDRRVQMAILSLISPKVPLGLLTALIRDVRPSVTGPYELEFRLFPSPAELLEPHYNASLDLKLLWHLSNIQSTVDMWNLAAPATVLGSGVSEYDEWLREDLASVMSFSRAPSVASPLKETSVFEHGSFRLGGIFGVDASRFCKDGVAGSLNLLPSMSDRRLKFAANALLDPVMRGRWVLVKWRKEVFDATLLRHRDWTVLMLAALEDISENELTSSMDSALRIVHATLVLKTLISLHSKQEKPEPLPFDLDELLNRLRDCRFLQGRLSPNIWAKAKLTGANLNQSERRSVPYLLALEQCRHDEEGEAALDLSAFTAHFGAMILNELPVYLAHLNALRWLRTPLDLRALERCVAFTKIVKHPVVRNALILVLFTDMIAPKLRSIVEVVEKGRRAPQDIVAVRTTGLDRTAALAFLASSLALLENITMEAGCVGTSEMVQDATEAFRVPPLKSVEAFADETLGAILRVLEGEQQVISGKVTNEFKSLIKFLRTLFLHDIRIVRPSKLFDESVNRATSLLRPEDWSEEDLAFDEVLISERHAFVTKLPSPSESPF